jgi:glycosyltransferase involved in cell wall biosynthesis
MMGGTEQTRRNSQTKRILAINKFCPCHRDAGGAEKRLGEVCARLSEDHDVHVLGACTGSHDEDGFTPHEPPLTQNVVLDHFILSFALPVYSLLLKPDVIYEDISVTPWLAPILCFWVPTVSIVHNFNGEELMRRGHYAKGFFLTVADQLTTYLYRSQPMIVVSQHMQDVLDEAGFGDVSLIYNGVDQDLFSMSVQNEANNVLYLGRLEYRKGPDVFIDVVEHLPSSIDAHMAGRNQGTYTIPSRINYHGYVTDQEKRILLSASSCVVIPSRWEGFGIVALEAAATGTPVVANDASGLREAVAANNIGVIEEFEDEESAAQTIARVAGETWDAYGLRENVRDYTWERTARLTEEVLIDEAS